MSNMNVLNFEDLLHEHAYLSGSLADTQQRRARLEEVIKKKVTSAKAQGHKAKKFYKIKKAVRQCRQDEHTLICTLTECVNKIEGLKRHQLAVEQGQTALSWSFPQQEEWAGHSSSPTAPQWSAGWYIGAVPPIPASAPLAQIPLQTHFTTPQLVVYPYAIADGHSAALVNSILGRPPYELILPGYAPPSFHGTSSSSPALDPSAPEFKYEDARSDGMASLSLSVTAEPVLTNASATEANKGTGEPLVANEAGTTEHDSQVSTALRSMDAAQPAFHRNNKPAPLVHASIMRMKSSAMRSPEELISPRSVPQIKRRYSDEAIECIGGRLRSSRNVTFAESSFKGFEYPGPEPDTPMKGPKRGAKSELSRALKKVDENMWEQSGSGHEECTDDEGQYVGYGIVWNWEDGGAVWPKTPLAVRTRP